MQLPFELVRVHGQPEGQSGFYYANDTQPAWSPDGARLVFVSETGYDDGFQPYESRRLAIVNADGSAARELTGSTPRTRSGHAAG